MSQIAVSRGSLSASVFLTESAQARSPEYASPIGTPSSAELAAQALLLNRTPANRAAPGNGSAATSTDHPSKHDRLRFAKLMDDDVEVVPGYAADDKEYVSPAS